MRLDILISDPEKVLASAGQISMKLILTRMLAFSIIFGVIDGANIYLLGWNFLKFAIYLDTSLEAASSGGTNMLLPPNGLGAYLSNAALAVAIAAFISRLAVTVLMPAAVYLLMRWQGSRIEYAALLGSSVLLLPFPLIVSAFSILMNVLSYLLAGYVPTLNTALVPAAGWIAYYLLLGGRYWAVGGLKGWKGFVAMLPIAFLVAGSILVAVLLASWPIIVSKAVDSTLEAVLG